MLRAAKVHCQERLLVFTVMWRCWNLFFFKNDNTQCARQKHVQQVDLCGEVCVSITRIRGCKTSETEHPLHTTLTHTHIHMTWLWSVAIQLITIKLIFGTEVAWLFHYRRSQSESIASDVISDWHRKSLSLKHCSKHKVQWGSVCRTVPLIESCNKSSDYLVWRLIPTKDGW